MTNNQLTAIKIAFSSNCENEKSPIKKPFHSAGGKWLVKAIRWENIITWYETGADGKIVKYYDNMPEY